MPDQVDSDEIRFHTAILEAVLHVYPYLVVPALLNSFIQCAKSAFFSKYFVDFVEAFQVSQARFVISFDRFPFTITINLLITFRSVELFG